MLTEAQIFELLKTLIPYIVTLGLGAIGGWEIVNGKIAKMKAFWDIVYEATFDKNVTDKEFEAMVKAGINIFK